MRRFDKIQILEGGMLADTKAGRSEGTLMEEGI